MTERLVLAYEYVAVADRLGRALEVRRDREVGWWAERAILDRRR